MTRAPSPPNPARRRFLRALLAGTLGVGVLGGSGVAQAYSLSITRHTRPLPGLRRPVTVAFLTDLHYGPLIGTGSVRRWVNATNALRPDIILLGGDQLDQGLDSLPGPLFTELARLRAPLGVYGVWGNHDYGSFGQSGPGSSVPSAANWTAKQLEVSLAFQKAGVTILQNQGVGVRDDLFIGGVDDFIRGRPDARRALRDAGPRASILLSHNPDYLPELPPGIGLTLCGHTHGGQVRFPMIGAPVVPSKYGQRYAMGWFTDAHGNPAYVSRGLGLTGIPVRNLCPPEITLLTLTGGKSEG